MKGSGFGITSASDSNRGLVFTMGGLTVEIPQPRGIKGLVSPPKPPAQNPVGVGGNLVAAPTGVTTPSRSGCSPGLAPQWGLTGAGRGAVGRSGSRLLVSGTCSFASVDAPPSSTPFPAERNATLRWTDRQRGPRPALPHPRHLRDGRARLLGWLTLFAARCRLRVPM